MGMAAGQARLLSITSRMSDNELRAQLINNDKMRLATKSAQVSEAYTTALNEAQLMFTNYDKDNNTSYKELTFNSLTAYNQYNNQYAISNAAGQLLVSETDAKNFQKSKDLNEFLACYGLEQTTTYFDETLTKGQGGKYWVLGPDGKAIETTTPSAGVVYNTDSIYPDANGISKTIQIDSGWTAEELQKMYEGTDGYAGYMNIKSSPEYFEYQTLISQYTTQKSLFEESIAQKVSEMIKNGGDFSIPDTTVNTTKTSPNEVSAEIDKLKKLIGTPGESGKPSPNDTTGKTFWDYSDGSEASRSYYNQVLKDLDDIKNGTVTTSASELEWDKNSKTLKYNDGDDNIFTLKKGELTGWSGTVNVPDTDKEKDEETGEYPVKEETATDFAKNSDGTITFKAGDTTYVIPDPDEEAGNIDNNTGKFKDGLTFTETTPLDATTMNESLTGIINSLKTSLIKFISKDLQVFKDMDTYKNYQNAAKSLYTFIYGNENGFSSLGADNWDKLTDVNYITDSKNEAINGGTFSKINKKDEKGNDILDDNNQPITIDCAERFAKIKQAMVLDYIMDTYGEPNYDWIDKDNKNTNGSAKAQWYQNLYNKMETSGYKALQDGLASSSEWIKFAFESGLVCLEQVDANNAWHATTYTNCSDITEQTNNAAITKAEAEYNAAMAKIENKDKRYDLELKNIDTEHNSLQTEYDSIKTAIDKNIERTFKIYS